MANDAFRFGDFLLHPENRLLARNGRPVELNSRYLDALHLLVRDAGALVTKDRFLDEVWQGIPVTDEALTQCIKMLRKALDSFARLDVTMAAQVVRLDDQVDEEFRTIMRYLITFMMEDPRTISTALEILFVAKAIERIGDHSKNIAEYVIYMVKGRDVRHVTVDEIEREVKL